ncbi:P-loop containing nucleoside triphosphate hydrolase protein [Chytridium lagenaria]|nr:P-loop containing nucleoside triphosphate hydrolase protein [Chytridium lagenaria]
MTSVYNFKKIQVIPTSTDFIDVVLSKIQRKTPTIVHPNYQISRIRQFYMKKVKFAQDCFDEKLNQILDDFPKMDEIHPFYSDLMNVLYDKDHYKLALGQLNMARHLVDNVARDYNRLLKFGDSLFRCKQLKRAALGRMATIMKRQKDSLAYLEQVRQHLARLPSIDPNTRTLLVCGYPNVGKSSFMNKLTRAEVEVQPYAFTTKSLFVGHMDYKNLRWQVIDTPGILDHPLEERNTIEMQSITALAHLRSAVLFFLDASEQCGYSIQAQCRLFESIKPLFANKPTMLVVTKIDTVRFEDVTGVDKVAIEKCLEGEVGLAQLSCYTEEGVMDVKKMACDKLLAARVEMKMKGGKVENVLHKLHLATPTARDDIERPAFIPPSALTRPKYDPTDPNRRLLEKDLEVAAGGAGVHNIDLKKLYILRSDEWKYDSIPEIMDGKNVADFVDPEIEARLEALEREEERLVAEGFYEDAGEEMEMDEEEEEMLEQAAKEVEEARTQIIHASRLKKGKNRPVIPQKFKARLRTLDEMTSKFKDRGIPIDEEAIRSRSLVRRKRGRSESRGAPMDSDEEMEPRSKSTGSLAREQSIAAKRFKGENGFSKRDRSSAGVKNGKQMETSDKILKFAQRPRNYNAKASESDRHIPTKMPKHLFSGKRGSGSASHR